MPRQAQRIRGIIFDLDGTLYVSPGFAATIQETACSYIAGLKGIATDQACRLLATTRSLLREETQSMNTETRNLPLPGNFIFGFCSIYR